MHQLWAKPQKAHTSNNKQQGAWHRHDVELCNYWLFGVILMHSELARSHKANTQNTKAIGPSQQKPYKILDISLVRQYNSVISHKTDLVYNFLIHNSKQTRLYLSCAAFWISTPFYLNSVEERLLWARLTTQIYNSFVFRPRYTYSTFWSIFTVDFACQFFGLPVEPLTLQGH